MQTTSPCLPVLLTSLAVALAAVPASAQAWNTVTRVSVSSTGAEANGPSEDRGDANISVSSDGRFIAYSSAASNLVPVDTNGIADIFVRDLLLGTTARVSVSSSGQQGNAGSSGSTGGLGSYGTSLSADGRYVAFHSYSSNLVSGDSGGNSDVFVHDRVTGATGRVSVSTSNKSPNGASQSPTLSADGRYVLYDSFASNLVSGDRNKQWDVFLRDLWTGTTQRVSVSSTGAEANGGSWRLFCRSSLSADGRCAVFASAATNLVPGDTNNNWDVFVRDTWTNTTERVSVTSSGAQADGASDHACISADGRFVGFASNAPNLTPSGTPAADRQQVYVHDRLLGTTECVSVSSGGLVASPGGYVTPALSADGRYVAFDSMASNLVPGDTNGTIDIFVHDRLLGATTLIANTMGGIEVSLDGSGASIAFTSLATDLVPGDTNGVRDVFVVR